jgi:hypothetical protein
MLYKRKSRTELYVKEGQKRAEKYVRAGVYIV